MGILFCFLRFVLFLPWFGLTIKAEECKEAKPSDIIFLLDGSGSVGVSGFRKSLAWMATLLDAFPIGPSATQIGLAVFDHTTRTQFNLNTHSTATNLKSAILNTQFPDGGTNIPGAIEFAGHMFKSTDTGRRFHVTGILILMTDGITSDFQRSIDAAQKLKDTGIIIYTASVGFFTNTQELQSVATSLSYYFNTNNYDSLNTITGPITLSACKDMDGCICYNGGTCTSNFLDYKCDCPRLYTGAHCETKVCDSFPCQNEGVCEETDVDWFCTCKTGYTGTVCDIDIDECESSPCQNGATCHNCVNAFYCECPPRYYGLYCETGECQPSVADLAFVLDSSTSQTKKEFEKQLEFINSFIDKIVIGEKNLQISVITYSFEAVTEISLGQYQDNVTLKDAIRKIKYRPGATFTHKGLAKAKVEFDNTSRIRPFGHFAKRYAFVLTDGMSNNRAATVEAARNLKATVNKVLAIGIGKEVSHTELIAIASTDDSGRELVYSVQNFNALYTVVKELIQLTCEECSWRTSADIVFLLDMSLTMSPDDFQTGLNAITYLTDRTSQMETDNSTVRIALVTYGDMADVQLYRGLNDTETKRSFLLSIQKLFQSNGYCQSESNSCEQSKLLDALKYSDNVFHENSDSTNREIVIVLSDGHEAVNDEMKSKSESMMQKGRSIYSVALGEIANINNLKSIVGDPALVFSVYDDLTMKVLDALTTEFFFNSCDLSNDFLDGS